MDRRSFLTGLISFVAAPAIVRAGSLMPVKVMKPPFIGDIRFQCLFYPAVLKTEGMSVAYDEIVPMVWNGTLWKIHDEFRNPAPAPALIPSQNAIVFSPGLPPIPHEEIWPRKS